jgi:CheY-like chemotaxis protein
MVESQQHVTGIVNHLNLAASSNSPTEKTKPRKAQDSSVEILFQSTSSESGEGLPHPEENADPVEDADKPPVAVIVEDDPDAMAINRKALEQMDIDVISVRNPDIAFDVIEKVNPDLILMDLMMPGTNGWQVVAEIKAHADLQDIPIIIITGLATDEEQAFAATSGKVADFIVKPVSYKRLRESILRALNR